MAYFQRIPGNILSFTAAATSSLLIMSLAANAAPQWGSDLRMFPSSKPRPIVLAENGLGWSRERGLDAIHTVRGLFAQGEGTSDDEGEVAPAAVEKYIEVQKAMQKNHSLTVEQACTQQGIQIASFRDIENRIERDDALRERVRKALRDSTAKAPTK